MADKLRLKVITPDSLVFDGEVEEIVVPEELGEFGVLPCHVPLLSALFLGRLRFRAEGSGETVFIVHGGLADVKDDTVERTYGSSGAARGCGHLDGAGGHRGSFQENRRSSG